MASINKLVGAVTVRLQIKRKCELHKSWRNIDYSQPQGELLIYFINISNSLALTSQLQLVSSCLPCCMTTSPAFTLVANMASKISLQ